VDQVGSWYRVKLPADATRVGYILVRQVTAGKGGAPIPPSSPRSPQPRSPQQPAGARRRTPRRAFVSASAAYQPAVLKFDNKVTFTDFVETGSRTTTYKTARRAGFGSRLRANSAFRRSARESSIPISEWADDVLVAPGWLVKAGVNSQ
jgi:hypothetical protein